MRLSVTRFATSPIRMSWLTRSKNFSRSMSTTTPCPDAIILLRPFHRLMRRAPRPEAEARLGERPVPIRLQHLHHRLLDEAVEHRRDAEQPYAARRLRYLHTPHRLRLVGAVKQLSPDRGPVLLQVGSQCRRHSCRRCPPLLCCASLAPTPSSDSHARPLLPSTALRPPGVRDRLVAARASVSSAAALRASPFAPVPKFSSI